MRKLLAEKSLRRKKIEFNYLHSRQNMIVCNIVEMFFDILGKGGNGEKDEVRRMKTPSLGQSWQSDLNPG